MTTAIDGTIVHEQHGSTRIVHRCATRRVAQILAATIELHEAGWEIGGLNSSDRPRRSLLLTGERLFKLLDGRRSDERAQGFVASRGVDSLTIDACAGMTPVVIRERGDTAEARGIIEWHLGPLA